MKKILWVFLILLHIEKASAEVITHEVSMPTEQAKVKVYFTNNNQHTIQNSQDQFSQSDSQSSSQSFSRSTSRSKSSSSVQAQIQTTIQTQFQTLVKTMQEQLSHQNIQNIKEQAEKQYSTARAITVKYLQEQKYTIPIVFFATGYGYVFYKLLSYSYQTLRSDTWASWKEDIPLEMLRMLPEQELGKELVFAAQEKYQHADMLNDLLSPLIFFLRDIDYDLQQLKSFIRLQQWLQKLHLTYFFPLHEKLLHSAQQKHARLLYLKNVFIHWVTDYKLALETKKSDAV